MKREADNKKTNKEDLPGYPHYSSDEDITDPDNNTGQLAFNEENIKQGDDTSEPENITVPPTEEDDVKIVMGTEADVTDDDLALLDDDADPNLKWGALDEIDEDGDLLNEDDDLSDDADLDVPGSEEDDENERIGEEDEENNYYSLNDDNDDATTEGIP